MTSPAAEAARYKLGRLTADDQDGYHRVQCPAAAGKIRCLLRPPQRRRARLRHRQRRASSDIACG
jgi:hypothetical protein